MPPIKIQNNNNGGGGDVSDGDVSGAESERSNTSRENEGRRDSSEDEADSDDSSEMDEGECEMRRTQLLQHVQDLEDQFGQLREQLYRERIAQVDLQLTEIKAGRSPEYLNKLQELQDNMHSRIHVAGILKQLRLENIENKYRAEEQAALQNFENEKILAWDYYHDELEERIKHLEEDRHNVEINWSEGGEYGFRSRSRSRRKAVTVSGPYIVYMLKPQDIMEDWTLIRKALKRSP